MNKEKFKLNLDENCKKQLIFALEKATGIEFEDITIDTFKNLIYRKLDEYCYVECNNICKKEEKINKEKCLIKNFIDNLMKGV